GGSPGAGRGTDRQTHLRAGIDAGRGPSRVRPPVRSGGADRARAVKASHEALLDAFQVALVGRDRPRLHEVCASDLHYEDPLCSRPLAGPDELADHISRLWQAFPDARIERLGERLGDGRYISAPVRLRGTHTGDLGTIPASGRVLDVHAVLICELDP